MTRVIRHRSDLSDLHVFHAVAVAGSINAAARELRVDPSTVSRSLEQLEARLNCKLVRRTSQGVTLTKAGEQALTRVRTIEHLIADLEREVVEAENELPAGVVTISCSDAIGAYVLTPSLPALLRENPKIDVGLDCGLWPDDPIAMDAEIALVYNGEPSAGYVSRTVAHVHYGLFGSKSFLKLYGAPSSIEEALRHPYLHHTAQRHTSSMDRSVPAFQSLARRRVETNSSAAIVEGVLAGTGLAAMPTFLAATYPDLVMLSPPLAPLSLTLMYHRDIERVSRIKSVLAWLDQVFDLNEKPWFRQEFVSPRQFPERLEGESTNASAQTGKNTAAGLQKGQRASKR